MTIRTLTIDDLPEAVKMGGQFYEETKFPGKFNPVAFEHNWAMFITGGMGAIFGLFKDDVLIGGLGAVVLPDTTSGDLRAMEMFWFVSRENRGGGAALLAEYEKWAVEKGAKTITVAYLESSMPEKVKGIYERNGYRLFEAHYLKEVAN